MSRETSRGAGTVRQLCRALRISPQAFYAAARRPVEPEVRSPLADREGPWAPTSRVVEAIRAGVEREPAWGIRLVWAALRREGLLVSRKRVARLMKALGLVFPRPEERETGAPRGHVAVAESNRRWATDLTTTWTRRDGTVAIVPVIDCGDRVVLALEATKPQDAPAVLEPVARSLAEQFGDPSAVPLWLELRTDHGPQYTGSDCEDLCRNWRVEHTRAPVGRPTGNAVVERFILTLKVELLWTREWECLAELRLALAAWVLRYNHHRPHQALGYETPAERRERNLGEPKQLAA